MYTLTFLAMQSSRGATLDKHCHMVVQLSEAQPMGPVSYDPLPCSRLPQIPRCVPAQGTASPHCFTCVSANSVISKKSNIIVVRMTIAKLY